MRRWTGTGVALATVGVAVFLMARAASTQQSDVAFWVASATIDTSVDVGMPTGPSRSTNQDLCTGSGNCPTTCPAPVQNFVFVNTGGGGASRLTDIVMSAEVRPGSKCRQFTAGGTCTVLGAGGTRTDWNKFVASVCD